MDLQRLLHHTVDEGVLERGECCEELVGGEGADESTAGTWGEE